MPSLITAMDDKFKERLDLFPWVNWSEVAREESLKRVLFEKYVRTGMLSDEEWAVCEKMDWIPGDWLPLKEEFIEKLKKAKNKPSGKSMTVDEFNKWCESL